MKKLRIVALMTLLAFVSANSFGSGFLQKWRYDKHQEISKKKANDLKQKKTSDNEALKKVKDQRQKKVKKIKKPHPGQQTGAPIDGGLLLLLGAAGATYYGARKKKKNSIEG